MRDNEMIRARHTWGKFMSWVDFQIEYEKHRVPAPLVLRDVPMKLKYWNPDTGVLVGGGHTKFEEAWYADWLDSMVKTHDDIIFFLVTDSTDVFEDEEEIDFNTVVYMADNNVMRHTYDPKCPPRCYGQLEGCQHKKEV